MKNINAATAGTGGYLVGLTGAMAAGKNTAAEILQKNGFTVLDADSIAHGALETLKPQVLELFEHEAQRHRISLVNDDGSLHRRNLASIVFKDTQQLKRLERLIHPVVNDIIEKRIAETPSGSYVVNAALLYKMPLIKRCDCILFISAPCVIRFIRVKKRDKLPFMRIMERFFAQRQIFAKCKKQNADIYRVGNFGTKKRLQSNIEAVLQSSVYKG